MCPKPINVINGVAAVLTITGMFITDLAVGQTLQEKDLDTTAKYEEGRVVSVEAKVGHSHGGPVNRRYEIASASPYPQGAVLEIEASASVESGYYEVAFLYQGKPSFVLAASPDKPVKGKGKVDVTSDGLHLECRITSKSAKNVRYAFTILTPSPGAKLPPVAQVTGDQKGKTAVPGEQDSYRQQLEALHAEAVRLRDAGKPADAIPVARAAVELAVKNAGEASVDVAKSLDLLEKASESAGDAAAAKAAAGRALSARKKVVGKRLTEAGTFESDAGTPPMEQREYRKVFRDDTTRYVNWEARFKIPALGKRTEFDLEAIWLKDNGVYHRHTTKGRIEADWTRPAITSGYGSRTPGTWKPGRYAIEFFLDGERIGRAEYEIVGQTSAGPSPGTAPRTGLLGGVVPAYPGAKTVADDACPPGQMQCHSLIQTDESKSKVFDFYQKTLASDGWVKDAAVHGSGEAGSLQNDLIWGMMNWTKGKMNLVIIVPSNKKTGSVATQVDFTLLNPEAGKSFADIAKQIPRFVVVRNDMNKRFAFQDWALTVLSADRVGAVITRTQGYNPFAPYTFRTDDAGAVLLRVKVDLERLDGKPIGENLVSTGNPKVKDSDGREYGWIGAGTENGEYYDGRRGGLQSILLPVTAKSKVEYVFPVPKNALITEFVWGDKGGIGIQVK
jgi:murein DD-endopeptidase MepM/ murein hydrolase activator NlpD